MCFLGSSINTCFCSFPPHLDLKSRQLFGPQDLLQDLDQNQTCRYCPWLVTLFHCEFDMETPPIESHWARLSQIIPLYHHFDHFWMFRTVQVIETFPFAKFMYKSFYNKNQQMINLHQQIPTCFFPGYKHILLTGKPSVGRHVVSKQLDGESPAKVDWNQV